MQRRMLSLLAVCCTAVVGVAVEVASRTSETAKVMANPDGTFTLTSNTVPVRVKKNSAWTPIDTTLTKNADGTLSPNASPCQWPSPPAAPGRRSRSPRRMTPRACR